MDEQTLKTLDALNNTNKDVDASGFYTYKGKRVYVLDVNGCKAEQTISRIDKAIPIIRGEADKSVLLLTDLRDLVYSADSLEAAKNFAKGNERVVLKSAMLGITGLKKIAFNTLIRFSGRSNIKIFDVPDDAMEWLVL